MRVAISASLLDVIRQRMDGINVELEESWAKKEREIAKKEQDLARKEIEMKLRLEMMIVDKVEAAMSRPSARDQMDENSVLALIEKAWNDKEAKEERVDYALESQGGSVIDEASSETYLESPATWSLLGVPLW